MTTLITTILNIALGFVFIFDNITNKLALRPVKLINDNNIAYSGVIAISIAYVGFILYIMWAMWLGFEQGFILILLIYYQVIENYIYKRLIFLEV